MNDLMGTLTRTDLVGTVTMHHDYATTPDDLWQAITDPERLARWFAPVTGDLHQGGEYRVVFEEDDPSQRVWGRIERCEAPHHLVLTWNFPGEQPDSRVSVTLQPQGSGTRLSLVHEGLDHGNDVGYAAGWQVYLGQLERSLAGEERPDLWQHWGDWRDAYQATLG